MLRSFIIFRVWGKARSFAATTFPFRFSNRTVGKSARRSRSKAANAIRDVIIDDRLVGMVRLAWD